MALTFEFRNSDYAKIQGYSVTHRCYQTHFDGKNHGKKNFNIQM